MKCAQNNVTLLFFPDFSPATAIRRKSFGPVLKKMTALGLQPLLIYPAVIKLRHKGEQRSFDSPLNAEDFVSSLFQRTTRQKYYFESERPSHLLALRLKECESKAYISVIKSSDDQVTTILWQLMTYLKIFTQICIKPKTDFDEPICKQYLDKLELPRISQIDKESLEAPLSLEELHVSLKSLQRANRRV